MIRIEARDLGLVLPQPRHVEAVAAAAVIPPVRRMRVPIGGAGAPLVREGRVAGVDLHDRRQQEELDEQMALLLQIEEDEV